MSLFTDDRYCWRETYFVFFEPERRPLLRDIQRELKDHAGTFRLLEEQTDRADRLQTLTIASYEDHAALDVSYHAGDNVTAEIRGLIETLGRECSAREKEKLLRLTRYRAKFDVLHFEQTAGTAAFKVVKVPEVHFAQTHNSQHVTKARFRFDPDNYQNCAFNGLPADDDDRQDAGMDSAVFERVDPNTLVLFLEMLCRLTHGTAIDPASGVFL